jgi:hypothetical protein
LHSALGGRITLHWVAELIAFSTSLLMSSIGCDSVCCGSGSAVTRPRASASPRNQKIFSNSCTTTANEYIEDLPDSVKKTVGAVYTKGGKVQQVADDLLPNATNVSEETAVSA